MPALRFAREHLLLQAPAGPYLPLFLIFLAAGALSLLYAGARRKTPLSCMLLHIGGGMLALWAGDLITLLIGWELLSFSAFFMIYRPRRSRNRRAALRYLRYQIAAAAFLFVGMAVQKTATGSLALAVVVPAAQPYLLLAIALKTAAIPLHGWLVDGYSAAPFPVAPLLSIYATKVGVFTAARLLDLPATVYLGAFMAVAGVVGALRQTRGTRLLSYHIISQVGYMLAGVGLATELGIQAGLFHAVNHIAYKALLFMVMGAVMLRTGHDRLHDLGELAGVMPWTFAAGLIASASIAGLPPFNGFASKELLAVAIGDTPGVKFLLTLASVGTGVSFLKFMTTIFVRAPLTPPTLRGHGLPAPMHCAMGALALFCLAGGLFPAWVMPYAQHRYYSASALGSALLPLAAAALLWALVRKRLMAQRAGRPHGVPQPQTLRRLRALRRAVLATHALAWQPCLSAILLVWTLILLLLHA